jgi:hypothetical protein
MDFLTFGLNLHHTAALKSHFTHHTPGAAKTAPFPIRQISFPPIAPAKQSLLAITPSPPPNSPRRVRFSHGLMII